MEPENSTQQKPKKRISILTFSELVLTLLLSAAVVAIGYFALNPMASIDQVRSDQAIAEIEALAEGLDNYKAQAEQPIPTYDSGKPLPTVTTENFLEEGVNLTSVDGLIDEYITQFPDNSTSIDYKIGVLSGGTIIVGAQLPNSEVYSKLVE